MKMKFQVSRKKARWLYILLFSFIGILIFFTPAKSVKAIQVGNLPIDVNPVQPPEQTDRSVGYFQANLTSGQQTNLTLDVRNLSSKKQTVVIRPVIATTSATGALMYEPNSYPKDSSLTLQFTKMVPKTRTLSLAGKTTQRVTFPLKVPAKTLFNGTVLGSLYVYSPSSMQATYKEQKRSKKRIQVMNFFSLYIGAIMNINNYQLAFPNFRLLDVRPEAIGGLPTVVAQLQNFKPAIITNGQLLINAQVYHRGGKKAIIKHELPAASFAPNSTMHFPLATKQGVLKAGNYTLRMHLTYKNKVWNLTRNFTITGDQIKNMDRILNPKPNYLWLWLLLAVLVFLLIIIFVMYMYRRGKRNAIKELQDKRQH